MARRSGGDAAIRRAEALARRPPGSVTTAEWSAALAEHHGLAIAATARAVQAHRATDQLPALAVALARLYEAEDPQAHGKLAALTSLDELGWEDPSPFLRAVAHVQMEPVWGGRIDAAAPLRIRAAQGLVRLGHHALWRILGDLLVDDVAEVRGAASQLLGQVGGERAALQLRLRVRLPEDREHAEVMGDHVAGLLACEGETALPLAVARLQSDELAEAQAVALAIGASRLPAALAPLADRLDDSIDRRLRRACIDGIALLRSPAAAELLLARLAEADAEEGSELLAALRVYRDRPEVVKRASAAVARTRHRSWREVWDVPGEAGGGDPQA
jgi:hypothetical protein